MYAALALAALLVAAEDPAGSAADGAQLRTRQEEVARIAPGEAKRLEIFVGNDESKTAQLYEEPLLRWSNPTAGSVYGEVFVWTIAQRPMAIASIYRWYHPFRDSTVEIVSVAESGVEAREAGKSQWKTKTPGVRFQPIPKAKPPAESAGARLIQMRELARRFTVELTDERGGDPVARDLRLLNQPLYRYASPSQKVIDGALFAFVEGTDPEAWIVLEAVTTDKGPAWRYASVRMNIDPLNLRLDGTIVMTWPKLRQAWRDRTTPYVTFNFDPEQVAASGD